MPQRILNHSSEVFIDLDFKQSSELEVSGMCVRPGEYGGEGGWAAIFVTSHDVRRTICLGDKDERPGFVILERWREKDGERGEQRGNTSPDNPQSAFLLV